MHLRIPNTFGGESQSDWLALFISPYCWQSTMSHGYTETLREVQSAPLFSWRTLNNLPLPFHPFSLTARLCPKIVVLVIWSSNSFLSGNQPLCFEPWISSSMRALQVATWAHSPFSHWKTQLKEPGRFAKKPNHFWSSDIVFQTKHSRKRSPSIKNGRAQPKTGECRHSALCMTSARCLASPVSDVLTRWRQSIAVAHRFGFSFKSTIRCICAISDKNLRDDGKQIRPNFLAMFSSLD